MKKLLALTLLAAWLTMCLGGWALAATVTFSGDCNVRSAPSIHASSIGVVGPYADLDWMYDKSVDDRGVTWYKVRYNGGSGWVSSKYAFLDDDDGVDGVWVQVYGDSNIRETPGLNGNKIGVAYRGASLDYIGSTFCDDRGVDWYRVSFNGREGWISSAYSELME